MSSDFVAYCMFAFASFRVPEDLSLPIHILRSVMSMSQFSDILNASQMDRRNRTHWV